MIRTGYTVIELVVALAISALLLALTIPRYDTYEQHIAFRGGMQNLVSCLQAANTSVTAPQSGLTGVPAVAMTSVVLASSASDTISCQLTYRDAASGAIASSPGAMYSQPAYLCSAMYGTSNGILPLSFTVSATNNGAIDSVTYGNGQIYPTSLELGHFQQTTLKFSDQQPAGSTCTDPITITIPVSGSPVELSN